MRRIEEVASWRLIEKFSSNSDYSSCSVHVQAHPDSVVVEYNNTSLELSRREARVLAQSLKDSLTQEYEFLQTTGNHRHNGEYVVERRNADSSGHRKVFDSFDNLKRLYKRLPEEFSADDLGRSGLTNGRKHMVLWHFVEHPEFPCRLLKRQPLTAKKEK
ncbi:MAG: hypothetical protein ABEI06_01675 [Halobacteriaceae archaeon]